MSKNPSTTNITIFKGHLTEINWQCDQAIRALNNIKSQIDYVLSDSESETK